MFGKEKEKQPGQRPPIAEQIEVEIGSQTTMSGQIRCDGSIKIDGVIEGGSIESTGNVVISNQAKVMADIQARTISIAGAYKGNIVADRVELLAGGRIWGNLRVYSFLLDEGGFFRGTLEMQEEAPAMPFPEEQPEEAIPVEE